MVTKFECDCGNTDTNKVKEYNGMLGYEALVCTCCGRYSDHLQKDMHKPNKWSLNFIGKLDL